MKNKTLKKISTAFFVFICAIALSVSSASYGYISSSGNMVRDAKLLKDSSHCKSMMNKASFKNTSPQFDTQRERSKAVAVGILFGARYAVDTAKNAAQDSGLTKVQAIKNYRTCLKNRALKS